MDAFAQILPFSGKSQNFSILESARDLDPEFLMVIFVVSALGNPAPVWKKVN
jgi:hypothetical protein